MLFKRFIAKWLQRKTRTFPFFMGWDNEDFVLAVNVQINGRN